MGEKDKLVYVWVLIFDKGVLLTCVSRFSSLSAKIIFDLEVVFQMVKHCCCNWDLAKTVVVILVFNLF